MTYTAQQLNTRIELQRSEGYRNDDGVWIEGWVTFGQVFAKVEPLVGNQYFAAASVWPKVPMKVTVRWRADLAVGQRVVIRGEGFEIESVQNIAFRNREALLMVQRLPNQ